MKTIARRTKGIAHYTLLRIDEHRDHGGRLVPRHLAITERKLILGSSTVLVRVLTSILLFDDEVMRQWEMMFA